MSHVTSTEKIIPPEAPDIPGLSFRHFRGPGDYEGIHLVSHAVELADRYHFLESLEDVERQFAYLVNSDPALDMIMAEVDGEMVGHARAQWELESGERDAYRHWFFLMLLPEWRGQGIEQAMLRWLEQRMSALAQDHPAGSTSTLDTWVPDSVPDFAGILTSECYEISRYFFHMARSLSGDLPATPLPDGFELRPVLPAHYRAIWDASTEASRDHYGFTEPDETRYDEWLDSPTHFQPRLWQIAWETSTNEVAGQVRTYVDESENEAHARKRGYTEFISVRRPFRRRGLARAMIAESLRVLRAEGMYESALTVDAENISGATRLYSDCGFEVEYQSYYYRKPLST